MPRLAVLLCAGLTLRTLAPAAADVSDFALESLRAATTEMFSTAANTAAAELMSAVLPQSLGMTALLQVPLDAASTGIFIAAVPAEPALPKFASTIDFPSEELLEVFRFPAAMTEASPGTREAEPLIGLGTENSIHSVDFPGRAPVGAGRSGLPSSDPYSAVPLMPRVGGGPVPVEASPFFAWLETNADLFAVMAIGIIMVWALFDYLRGRGPTPASGKLRQPPALRRRL
jgi:hypothetical protein